VFSVGSVPRGVPRKGIHLPPQHAATAGWRKEKTPPSRELSGLQTGEGGDAEKEVAEDTEDYNLTAPCMHFAAALRVRTEEQQQRQDTSGGSDRSRNNGTQGPCGLTPTGQSVRTANINSLHLRKC
jgi:hypothetical protein